MTYKDLPATIRTLRRSMSMTQADLAKKSGVSTSTIAKIELGRWNIRLETLGALSVALKTTTTSILSSSRK